MNLDRSHPAEPAIPAWNLEWRMGQPSAHFADNSFLAVDYCILGMSVVLAVEESPTGLDTGRQNSSVGSVRRVK